MRLVGMVGAVGDLIIIAFLWLVPLDLGDTLYYITILLAASAVYAVWVTHVFLPKRWDRIEEGSAKP